MDKVMYFLMGILLLGVFSIFNECRATSLSTLVEVEDLYIETEKRILANREFYLVNQHEARYDVNLGMNFQLPYTLYFNNKVNTITDHSQFRFVGYTFETGIEPFKGIEVYYQHFSGHGLDESFPQDFPQYNKIGIRWNIIRME